MFLNSSSSADTPESVKARLLAAQLLGQAATTSSQPFNSRGVTFAKAAAGLLSGMQERSALNDDQAATARSNQVMADALRAKFGGADASAGPGGAAPMPASAPTGGGLPAATMSFTGDGSASAPQVGGFSGDPGKASRSDVEAYIRQAAAQRGIDPDTAVKVAMSEGLRGWDTGRDGPSHQGDGGTSFGPFQLHYGGSGIKGMNAAGLGDDFTAKTGLDARDPSTWPKQVDFALDNAAKGGWTPFHGAANTRIGTWQGIGGSPQADMPAPNANPVGASILPPGITPDMIQPASVTMLQGAPDPNAAPPQAPSGPSPFGSLAPSAAGASTDPGMSSSERAALAAALLGKGGASPAVPLPGPPQDPNAANYALSPTGTRADMAPSSDVGGLGGASVSLDPSMMGGPTPGADTAMSLPLPQQGPMPPPGVQSLPAAPPDMGNPAAPGPSPQPPPDTSAMAPTPPPMAQAPAQQAISAAMSAPPPAAMAQALRQSPAPSPMWSGGMGGNDPSSARAFLSQQAQGPGPSSSLMAGLLSGQVQPPPTSTGSASTPSPQTMAQVLDPSRAPSAAPAPQQGAGLMDSIGRLLGGQPAQPPPAMPPTGNAAIDAALRDPRISDSIKLKLMEPQAHHYVFAPDGSSIMDADSGRVLGTGVQKPDQMQSVTTPDGKVFSFNPRTGTYTAGPEAGAAPTSEQKDYQTVVQQAQAAGQTPPTFSDYQQTLRKSGAANVSVDTKAENAEAQGRGQGLAKRINEIAEDGSKADQDAVAYQRLGDLLSTVNTGPKSAYLEKIRQATGLTLDPNTDQVQALNAAIQQLAPRLRVPGSGSQSDAELKNFQASLPTLLGTPGGNQKILDTFMGTVGYRQQRAAIAQKWQEGDITAKEADAQIAALPSPFVSKPKADGTSQPDAGAATRAGARKAPDGNWYVADPNRPGKYLQVQ